MVENGKSLVLPTYFRASMASEMPVNTAGLPPGLDGRELLGIRTEMSENGCNSSLEVRTCLEFARRCH